MHKIVAAKPAWRALAALIDFLLLAFLGLGFFAIAQTIFVKSSSSQAMNEAIETYQVESGLYYLDDSGDLKTYEDYNSYQKYETIMTTYYLSYLPSMDDAAKDYDIYWYNVFILGLDDAKHLFNEDQLSSIQEPSKDCSLFEYQVIDGNKEYDLLAIPAASLYKNDVLTVESKASLLRFYCSSEDRSVYYNALQDLFNREFFSSIFNKLSYYNLIYPLSISVPIAALVVYLFIPLCFKNGETFAKKMFHLCLVNKLGFRIKKGQLVLRALPSILVSMILLFFAPLVVSISVISIGAFGSYILAVVTKNKMAVHDYIAGTLVINEKDSLFYDDAASQEAGERLYKERMLAAEEEIIKGRKALEDEARAKAEVPKR